MPENHLANENPNYKKLNDLYSLQMAKGQLYETIITTKNINGLEMSPSHLKESSDLKVDNLKLYNNKKTNCSVNAAPIGVLCKNSKQIVLYLYEGTHTVHNIHHHDYFMVNITQNPILFTKSTLEDLGDEYFEYYNENNGIPFLKDADAFFVCRVGKIKEITKKNDLGSSKMSIVTADVEEVVQINSQAIPLNRGIYAVIESLIHYTRFELADEETKTSYWARIKEMDRVVKKVGSPPEKAALSEIINEIKKNFKDLD